MLLEIRRSKSCRPIVSTRKEATFYRVKTLTSEASTKEPLQKLNTQRKEYFWMFKILSYKRSTSQRWQRKSECNSGGQKDKVSILYWRSSIEFFNASRDNTTTSNKAGTKLHAPRPFPLNIFQEECSQGTSHAWPLNHNFDILVNVPHQRYWYTRRGKAGGGLEPKKCFLSQQ